MSSPEAGQGGESPYRDVFEGFYSKDGIEERFGPHPDLIGLITADDTVVYPAKQFRVGDDGSLEPRRAAVGLWRHREVQQLVAGDKDLQWQAAAFVLTPGPGAPFSTEELDMIDAQPPQDALQRYSEIREAVVSQIKRWQTAR